MKRKWLAILFLAFTAGAGCSTPVSTNASDYIGEYVFKPNNADPGKFADFVILKGGGTAVEIRFSRDTGEISSSPTRWYLDHGTDEEVVIGDFGHPIEGMKPSIKLGINDDLGQYYEKVR